MILAEVWQEKYSVYWNKFLNECQLIYSKCDKVLFKIIQTKLLSKISLKVKRVNENMSGELFARMVFFTTFHDKTIIYTNNVQKNNIFRLTLCKKWWEM